MKVKLLDLVNAEAALGDLAQAKISARMSFTLALVLKEVGKALEAQQVARRKLLERYGKPQADNPDTFKFEIETRKAFNDEYKEMLDTDVTLTGIGKIKASAIEAEGVKLSGADAFALAWLLKPDVETNFEPEPAEE